MRGSTMSSTYWPLLERGAARWGASPSARRSCSARRSRVAGSFRRTRSFAFDPRTFDDPAPTLGVGGHQRREFLRGAEVEGGALHDHAVAQLGLREDAPRLAVPP